MTLILTNDDGIDAPGLEALRQAIGGGGVIVAPKYPHSGCGHQVTTQRSIHLDRRTPTAIAIEGTPADCTRIAVCYLHRETEWVLSGINAGGNLGADIYISGTVAAVREAAFHRIPGIAISHYIHRRQAIDWEQAARLARLVLEKLLQLPIEPGQYWNVNLPHLDRTAPEPEIVFCPLCTQPLPAEYRSDGDYLHYAGEYGRRARDPGSDVDVCFAGQIAVTKLSV